MTAVIVTLHVIVCVFLIIVVLLQRGKGAEVGAVFGGGASSTVFGARGAGNFLTKLTTGSAIVFMLTSLTLSYLTTEEASERLFEEGTAQEQPAEKPLFEEMGQVPPEAPPATAAPDAAEAPEAAKPPAAPGEGGSQP